MQAPQQRMFDPDEEITFRFTAAEINTVMAILDTTTGFPHRITHPLMVKIEMQAASAAPRPMNPMPVMSDGGFTPPPEDNPAPPRRTGRVNA